MFRVPGFLWIMLCVACMTLAGCGSGGYAGGGITGLSTSAVNLDAGQSETINATIQGTNPITWTLSCTTGCGSVASSSAGSVVYSAPSGITSPLKLTLTGTTMGTTNSQSVSITVNPDPVITGAAPSGTVGTAYSMTLSATGGTGALKWSIASGTLPAGLSFNATSATISGTPTTVGESTFTAQITDSSDVPYTTTAQRTIVIAAGGAALSLTGNPTAGTVGTAYSTAFQAAGGTGPYTYSLTSGALPSGLSLSASTGVVSGTPTAAGTSGFTVQAQDSTGAKASGTYSIVIASGTSPLTISVASLPNGTVGTPYSSTIGVTGGTAPYTCTITSGTLPAGLSLGGGCVVSGTPTAAGTANLTVKATDSANPTATTSGPVSLTIAPAPLAITVASLPNGQVAVAYSATVGVSGGTGPYSCSVTSGTLPAGLSMGAGCVVSGTPTTAGTANLTVRATDSSNPVLNTSGPVSITIAPAGLSITTGALPGGTVAVPYSATIGVAGGTSPYSCSITSGALPAGLTLGAGCVVSGTPTVAGTSNLVVKATDAGSPMLTASGPVTVTIVPAPANIIISSPPTATVGTPYTGPIPVSGGAPPYTCTITAGTLPAGLTLGAGCVISGTPTTAGPSTITVKAVDSSNPVNTGTGPITVTVQAAGPTLMLASPPAATLNTPYTGTIPVTGGTGPYSCSISSGALPAGLTLGAGCVISGTPTVTGTSSVTVTATDSSHPQGSGTGPVTVTVGGGATLTLTSPPGATAGTPYSGPIGVTGGTAPYTCALVSGTLPAGLTLGTNCVVTGTPTTPGTSSITVKATDSGSPVVTSTGTVSIVVAPATLTLSVSSLPNGTVGVAYAQTIGAAGGTAPYSCTIMAGTLPAGLSLGAGCLVSGTPTTAGTSNLTVRVTDAGSPMQTATGPVSITIVASPLTVTVGALPNGTVGAPYSSTIGVLGGTGPYSCAITTGTLPAGLTLGAGCVVSGTPTTAGLSTMTVKATDSGNPVQTASGQVTITILPAALTLAVTTLPNGVVGTPYTATVGVNGGTAPYSCSITAGTLPAGLTLGAGCSVSGTPTVAGTSNLTVKATDAGTPSQTTSGPVSITITAAPTLTITSPPAATAGTPYTGTIGVTGGTAPYTCTITAGTLPTGLTLGAGCVVSGTPTTAGSSPITVKATDSSSPATTSSGPVTITVNAAAVTLTLSSPANATVATPYVGVIGVSNGTAPYSCTLAGGTLPAGLTLGSACTVTGTPTTAGVSTVSITATDASTPVKTTTGPVAITVLPVPPLTFTGSLPNATIGVAYNQTLHASGGIGPYTYAVTTGALPAGLTLSTAGVVSGTPTAPGASSFTVTATDSEATPQTAALPLVLLVVYPTTPNDPELTGPYAFLFQGYDDEVAGVLAYKTASVGSFTADGTGVLSAGELDSNHQTSNPTGNTISSSNFVGTYTIGTDQRGTMAITTLNADGTTGSTAIYAISVKAPVAPATVATKADMIEFDSNNLSGTKGSGTLLQQQPTTFAAGLTGSYAFGLSGDSPCLPACTVGIFAGPAASVGQFSTDGAGAISGGTGDENIAQTNLANSSLSGTYTTADGNGRLEMSMQTTGTPAGVYPTDYAVYLVGADQAFILSTDKHSSYILLAGTAQRQTTTTFSNASMSGPYVGYENSATNPGLVGATLQNVLNLSTSTIFRGTADAAGTCNTTNVDIGGLTGLVNGLTGLGSGAPILNALLGTYQSTGNSVCTVSSNGRGVLNYPAPSGLLPGILTLLGLGNTPPPARVFYLVAPNRGYFLETGYAGLGNFEPQTGSPFSFSTLNGTYVYGTTAASTVASIDGSGTFTADGAGHASTTTDLNVGVGTINILQLGVTGTQNYTLTDATAGRYLLGSSTVIYAISPTRFVLLDTSALSTSPSVVLLY
ncbi:beta strand repeat-containing protein [Granulicella pectinivorans]|uniref:beta strand repeat-containing protein n=1 Tax=Granulicella pectinivorans TaxID=474950 RepID=UPI001587C220|nr:Ig domain-containing protein [Granulicella pectinivorans]